MLKVIVGVLIAFSIIKFYKFFLVLLGSSVAFGIAIALLIIGFILFIKFAEWFGKTSFGQWMDAGDGKDRSFRLTRGLKEDSK